ncbi:MAG TPA: aquaporin [Candidatus Methylacidiphilales bacterium]|jgi:aquaporin Z|nr:aquaporin [Candidatus Methylacidiphilales bacterium]
MKKFIVEFIGTFFLVFTVGVTVVNPDAGVIAPLAIGSVLMVMVYAGGHISGGHYNPAVTLAVAVRGRLPVAEVPIYFLAQFLAASLAAGAAFYLKGPDLVNAPPPAYVLAQMVFAEFIFTFALAYVVLNVATAKATAGNSYYGLAIGFTVMVGAFAVGPISGGAFNPAVATGCYHLDLIPWGHYLAYVATEFSAGVLAAFVFRVLNPEDK